MLQHKLPLHLVTGADAAVAVDALGQVRSHVGVAKGPFPFAGDVSPSG